MKRRTLTVASWPGLLTWAGAGSSDRKARYSSPHGFRKSTPRRDGARLLAAALISLMALGLWAQPARAQSPPDRFWVKPEWLFSAVPGVGWGPDEGSDFPTLPGIGFAFGKRINGRVELEGSVLGSISGTRESGRHTSVWPEDGTTQTNFVREDSRGITVLFGINYFLREEGVNPYVIGAAGIGWGDSDREYVSITERPDAPPEERRHRDNRQGIGPATYVGFGVEVPLSRHWRLRPHIRAGYSLFVEGNPWLAAAVAVTYGGGAAAAIEKPPPVTPAHPVEEATPPPPPPSNRRGQRALLPPPTIDAPPLPRSRGDWTRVTSLGLGTMLRVRIKDDYAIHGEETLLTTPPKKLLGYFVAADPDWLVLQIDDKELEGRWRIRREAVEHVEAGQLGTDSPWEGIVAGLAVAAGATAVAAVGSDVSLAVIPVGTVMFGLPLAAIGGLVDYAQKGFITTELIYEAGA